MYRIFIGLVFSIMVSGCSTLNFGTGDKGVPYVFEPPTQGKHPGIIVLHTHAGLYDYEINYARELSKRGFVTAVVDYYAPGGTDNIGKAYDMLAANPKTRSDKIGILGFSKGAKYAIDQSNWELKFGNRKYSAIVSYYIGPNLGSNHEQLPPILFLHGDKDVYVSKSAIERFCKVQNDYNRVCEATIYPNVKHAFPRIYSDYNGYDANASRDAERKTLSFFKEHLSD